MNTCTYKMGVLTRFSQFQSLFSLDDIVSVFLESCELSLKDGEQVGCIVRTKFTLHSERKGDIKTSLHLPNTMPKEHYARFASKV